MRTFALPSVAWPVLAVAVAFLAITDAFSLTRIFYARDASFLWWPMHLWFRHTVFSGESPMWDPYVAFGQSALADPQRHLFFLPTLALRVLLPEVLGFNMSLALPVPLAALMGFLFLRRHGSPPAAALGALVFALSGPIVSTVGMMNNAWSAALVPYVLWSVDRVAEQRSFRRWALLAVAFGVQFLAAEPVSLAATAALGVAYAAVAAPLAEAHWRGGVGLALLTLGAGVAGFLLVAPQSLPLVEAVARSSRGLQGVPDVLSIQPLGLLEMFARPLFGDPFAPAADPNPWLKTFNDGREPYLYSIYFGAATGMLVLCGAFARNQRRQSVFWCGVVVVSLLCACGRHTPLYPLLQSAVPLLKSFRFPPKYLYITSMAIGTLVTLGWSALETREGSRRIPCGAASAALGVSMGTAVLWWVAAYAPQARDGLFVPVARLFPFQDAHAAAERLATSATAAMPRLALVAALAGVAALCLRTRLHAVARAGLLTLVVVDPLAMALLVNPTMDANLLGEPPWIAATRAHPDHRVYVAGRISWMVGQDKDSITRREGTPPGVTAPAMGALVNTLFSSFSGAWRVRDSVSIDQSFVWPREYSQMIQRLGFREPAERGRCLSRCGVGYYVLAQPLNPGSTKVVELTGFAPMALYESAPAIPRISVVTEASVEPSIDAQAERMFDESFDPSREVLLESGPPPPAGASGVAFEKRASIVDDAATTVTARVEVPEGGGYVLLLDSYDPYWTAVVDGEHARALRADALFRAVRVASGNHTVQFV